MREFPPHIIRKKIAGVLHEVHDPEIPGLSIVDLGMVLDIHAEDHQWKIDLAPTYSGCPAIDVIPFLAKARLKDDGFDDVMVRMVISPPWSTDWISEEGKEKLLAWGIAPPNGQAAILQDVGRPATCPQCGSSESELISRYGSTPCKAVYRCLSCEETFDYFKCY